MPQWLDRLLSSNPPPQWNEDNDKEKDYSLPNFVTDLDTQDSITLAAMNTPSSITRDQSLPPPVLQNGSTSQSSRKKRARVSGLAVHWARFKSRIGTGTAPSSSSVMMESAAEQSYSRRMETIDKSDPVDEVVVDRIWTEEIKSSVSHSEHGGTPEKSASQQPDKNVSDHESLVEDNRWTLSTPLTIIRYRTWPFLMEIFSSRFMDTRAEQHYAQENWFLQKSLAIWASLWLIVNWVLGCIFIPHNPVANLDKGFYFGIAPVLSLPIVFMVMYDWPRDRPYIYQVYLVISIWCWSFYQVIFILACRFYSNHPNCGNRDFLGTLYYATALQTIALFGLKLNRFPAAVGGFCFFLFSSIAVIPQKSTWGRTMINFFIFQSFLIYVHYVRESSERRLYTLRDQLKIQFKVRVPLNTALLAVQNMEASSAIPKDQEIEFNALCGSLSMMSKVLNDVLDFNRMDSGKFESMSRPYGFHQVMRSLFVPLRLATDARGLEFEANLDPNIDKVARKAAYKAMGETDENIRRYIEQNPNVDGVVTGDETRLRQIITNLASNACKFTPAGGKLTVTTRLILPSIPSDKDLLADPTTEQIVDMANGAQRPLSADYLTQHNMQQTGKPPPSLDWIVVRIEVTDTGFGIKPQDMAQSKLFSAFNQTEQGRQQGGKGTGLGLALVRQIVKLSGGRLGVKSKIGEGSTFWVELPLGVGGKTFVPGPPDLPDGSSTSDLHAIHRTSISWKTRAQCAIAPIAETVDAEPSTKTTKRKSASSLGQNDTAMQRIMDQGGRVELVLRSRDYDPPPSTSPVGITSEEIIPPPIPQPVAQAVDSPEPFPEQPAMPPDRPNEPGASDNGITPRMSSPTENSSLGLVPVQRPTYVKLPSRQQFSVDDPEAASGSGFNSSHSQQSNASDKSFYNFKMFDNQFARGGSSSASFTTINNVDPGLPVLVVDDDQLTRTLMKRILGRLGCKVSCAENGEVALEMILGQRITMGSTPSSDASRNAGPILELQEETPFTEEGKYAVVFLDNQMPVMSGLKVVEKLRELGRSDFIVGVTGNALLSDQEEYLSAGVDRVLTKPVLERSLRDILVLAEDRRKGQQQQQPPDEKDKLSSPP